MDGGLNGGSDFWGHASKFLEVAAFNSDKDGFFREAFGKEVLANVQDLAQSEAMNRDGSARGMGNVFPIKDVDSAWRMPEVDGIDNDNQVLSGKVIEQTHPPESELEEESVLREDGLKEVADGGGHAVVGD